VTPERIQRQRAKGWRMPEGAVYVGRPSRWGNPWPVGMRTDVQPWLALALGQRADLAGRQASAVMAFRWWLTNDGSAFPIPAPKPGPGDLEYTSGATRHLSDMPVAMGVMMLGRGTIVVPPVPDLAPLRGHDLVCWCPLDQPCHADVLLELANS
jgi:hypothetical protein